MEILSKFRKHPLLYVNPLFCMNKLQNSRKTCSILTKDYEFRGKSTRALFKSLEMIIEAPNANFS